MCCRKSDIGGVTQLMEADIPPIQSCLTPEKRGIKRDSEVSLFLPGNLTCNRTLLEVIATRLVTSREAIADYIKRTLLYHSTNSTNRPALRSLIKESWHH